MRVIGWLVLLFGCFALLVGLSMDTSVAVGFDGRRVHNIGRINDRNTALIVGAVGLVVGVLVLLLRRKPEPPPAVSAVQERRRACPHCAEQILAEAKVCRFCGRDVQPLPAAARVDEHALMNELGIRFEDGVYWFRDEQHRKLHDAVMSARITRAAERRSAP